MTLGQSAGQTRVLRVNLRRGMSVFRGALRIGLAALWLSDVTRFAHILACHAVV